MMNRRQQSDAASRFEERRRREDGAPRLRDKYPTLRSLRLELDEYRKGGSSPLVSHTRHVVVDRAPAHFVVQCSEPECDGDHDVTRQLLHMLATSTERLEGEHECYGSRHGSTCYNNLHFRARASYDV